MALSSASRGRLARKWRRVAAGARGRGRAVGVLGVHDHRESKAELGHVLVDAVRVQVGELVHVGRGAEGLEPEDPSVVQGAELRLVPGRARPIIRRR